MERAIKARKLIRMNITKACSKVKDEMNKEEPEDHILMAFRDDLSRLSDNIQIQDRIILDEMLNNDASKEDLSKESEGAEGYLSRISVATAEVNEHFKTSESNTTYYERNSTIGSAKKTYKLPKIEIKKFNGEVLEWLSFRSQFEKIHKDKDLHNSDKFQYLSQAMEEGTRAKELVKSYPQTADNYPKVVDALTDRFGKKKILKQVYVRELIKMIAVNVQNEDNVSLTKLYDNLESHLRGLESLGVTGEQTSEFLFPMVESALPEEILIAWQRSPNFGKDNTAVDPAETELFFLMQFLKLEVESEQQRCLARSGFLTNYTDQQIKTPKKSQSKVPTAASLYVGENSNAVSVCIFCDKLHSSQDCTKAMDMSLEAKQTFLIEKEAYARCLKIHGSQSCRGWVKCSGCSKQHYHILCPDSPKNKNAGSISAPSNNCNSIIESSKFTQNKQVSLKTIRVKIKAKNGDKIVRLLFDDGSQQSYINSALATETKCLEIEKYFEQNTLFGGIKTEIEERIIYRVQMESLNGNIKRNLELPDKKQITGDIVKIPNGPWMEELKSKGIFINDYESSGEDIDILIGADLIPFLVLNKSITLKCGLKAVKTIFGWTVMGPFPVQNHLITSFLVPDLREDTTLKESSDQDFTMKLCSKISWWEDHSSLNFENKRLVRIEDGIDRKFSMVLNGTQMFVSKLLFHIKLQFTKWYKELSQLGQANTPSWTKRRKKEKLKSDTLSIYTFNKN